MFDAFTDALWAKNGGRPTPPAPALPPAPAFLAEKLQRAASIGEQVEAAALGVRLLAGQRAAQQAIASAIATARTPAPRPAPAPAVPFALANEARRLNPLPSADAWTISAAL